MQDTDPLECPEYQETLQRIDESWQVPSERTERVWRRFLEILDAEEPGHPWSAAEEQAG